MDRIREEMREKKRGGGVNGREELGGRGGMGEGWVGREERGRSGSGGFGTLGAGVV